MVERLPGWFAVEGEICHSIRRVGQRLPDWVGDESNGMSKEEFEDRAKIKESKLPLDSVDPTESAVKPRSLFAEPVEMGT